MTIKLSDEALRRILELIALNPKSPVLRISVNGGGCAGFMYEYEFIEKADPEDYKIKKEGAVIAIDPISMQYLSDSSLEFIDELGNSYFKIQNPKASAKCGCGNSFNI